MGGKREEEGTFPFWEDPPSQKNGAREAERWLASPRKQQPCRLTPSVLLLCKVGANLAQPGPGAACNRTEEHVS